MTTLQNDSNNVYRKLNENYIHSVFLLLITECFQLSCFLEQYCSFLITSVNSSLTRMAKSLRISSLLDSEVWLDLTDWQNITGKYSEIQNDNQADENEEESKTYINEAEYINVIFCFFFFFFNLFSFTTNICGEKQSWTSSLLSALSAYWPLNRESAKRKQILVSCYW